MQPYKILLDLKQVYLQLVDQERDLNKHWRSWKRPQAEGTFQKHGKVIQWVLQCSISVRMAHIQMTGPHQCKAWPSCLNVDQLRGATLALKLLGKGAGGGADCDSLTPSQVFFPVTCPNKLPAGKRPSQSLFVWFCFSPWKPDLPQHGKKQRRLRRAWFSLARTQSK